MPAIIEIYAGAFDATARNSINAHLADLDNPHEVDKTDVGLGNVDNTSDADKPISTAAAAALALKAPLASPTFTGIPAAPTASLGTVTTQIATTAFAQAAANAVQGDVDGVVADLATHLADLDNPHEVNKTDVGLGNVDNTSDLNKPISTATQLALNALDINIDAIEADLATHEADVSNPHTVTATQVGLGNVDNTSDANKPVSTATQTALNLKANIASPTLTGIPAAPTASPGTDTTQIATTAFVTAAAALVTSATTTALALKANIASPALTGVPTSTTASPGDNSVRIATTAFVAAADALKADLASPTFTGVPVAPTAAPGTSTTQLATTAFVAAADALKANLASPTFTGVPAAPTAAPGTDTTQVATTAFVKAAGDILAAATATAQADADQALLEALPVPSLVAAADSDRPGEAVRLYGETKTGAPSAVTVIDPTWVTTSAAGSVVRVDVAFADDPQTVAPVGAYALETNRVYEIRWKVQRQTDPVDPLNDSVTLGIRWLQNTKAGVVSGGETTVENIPLVVADGIQERIVTVAASDRTGNGIDYNAPAGTIYFRPFVDLYGNGAGVTDIIVIDVVRVTYHTMLDIGLRDEVDGADPGVFLRRVITDETGGGAGTTAHGFVDESIFSRTGETAYASFDAKVTYEGTTDFDHYVGFQARPVFRQDGQINSIRMHDTGLAGGAATAITQNVIHYFAGGDADFNGTVEGTQYGLFVDEMAFGDADIWGIRVANNKCGFNETIINEDGRTQFPNGALGTAAIFMGSDEAIGIYRAGGTAMAAQYNGIQKFHVSELGIRVWDNTGLDSWIEHRGYKSADSLTVGNAIHAFGSPNAVTAASGSVFTKGFIVLVGETALDTARMVIGTSTAGNNSLDTALGGILPDTDIGMMFDSANERIDFINASTDPFARIAAHTDSFIHQDVDDIHRLFMTNANAGTGAGVEVALQNGATANDRMGMRINGAAFTTSGFQIQDAGVLYTGSGVPGGLVVASTDGPVQIFAGGGGQLAATLTDNSRPSLVIGNGVLATNATDGFLYIAGGAGPPSGTPTAFAGRYPLYWDATNNQLYIYDGGWLQPKTPAAAAIVTWQ